MRSSRRAPTLRVNCQTLADFGGRTRSQGPLESLHAFKVYASADSLALGLAYQCMDEVEFHGQLTPATCP